MIGKGDVFRDMGGLQSALMLAGKLGKLQAKILDTFKEVLNSDVGKAAVAEAMVPGSGAGLLGKPGARTSPAPAPPATDEEQATPAAP